MIKVVFFVFLVFFGCQQKPTKAIQESANAFDHHLVVLDTRSALDFESFHVEGSQSLRTEDFLILINPLATKKKQKRVLDPDLKQIVERLASKGLAPDKTVMLLGATKLSTENKKWRWLLSYLDIRDVQMASIEDFRKQKPGRFKIPESQKAWDLKTSEDFQKEFIYKKSAQCFVSWNEITCK